MKELEWTHINSHWTDKPKMTTELVAETACLRMNGNDETDIAEVCKLLLCLVSSLTPEIQRRLVAMYCGNTYVEVNQRSEV